MDRDRKTCISCYLVSRDDRMIGRRENETIRGATTRYLERLRLSRHNRSRARVMCVIFTVGSGFNMDLRYHNT
jgi:hypothetical protein